MGNTLYSKNRFKKIDITDIAVKKVRKISYHTLSSEQNDILFDLARIVLLTSKEKNQSKEVAITIHLHRHYLLKILDSFLDMLA